MGYDKYTDQLYAQKEFLYIDGIYEILLGYSFHELNYAEIRLKGGQDENEIGIELANAARAFGFLYIWTVLKFGVIKSKMYPLNRYFSWIDEDDILGKLKSKVPGFKISERAIDFMECVIGPHKYSDPDQNSLKKKEPFFPVPTNTKWEEVTITLLANNMVGIMIKDRNEKFTYNELNMADKRSGDKPKNAWWFLVRLLSENGHIKSDSQPFDPKLLNKAKAFNRCMRELFSIKDNPLYHYKQGKGYRAKFITMNKVHIDFESLLKLPSTPE